LRSPKIDFKESIPPAYVAWQAGTTNLFLYSIPIPYRLFKNSSTESLTIKMFVENGGMTAWNSGVMRQVSEVPLPRAPRLATWIEHVSLKRQLIEIFRS
jgi:hypothetical protein